MSTMRVSLPAARLVLNVTWLSLCTSLIIWLSGANAAIFLAVNHTCAHYLPNAVPALLTMLGNGLWDMALLTPCLWFAPRVNAAALLGAPAALLLTHLPKWLWHMPRPKVLYHADEAHFLAAPMGVNSFPSGHAMTVMMVATVLILGSDYLRQRRAGSLLILLLATLSAWSRVAVGAHWPLDVLVGMGAGMAVGWWSVRMTQAYPHWQSRRSRLLVATLFLLGVLALLLTPPTYGALEIPVRDMLTLFGGVCAVTAVLQLLRRPERWHVHLAYQS